MVLGSIRHAWRYSGFSRTGDSKMSHGDDPIGRFIDAIIDSGPFREAIASGDEVSIRAALAEKGIELQSPYDGQFIQACQAITDAGAWPSMDSLRLALLKDGGIHPLG